MARAVRHYKREPTISFLQRKYGPDWKEVVTKLVESAPSMSEAFRQLGLPATRSSASFLSRLGLEFEEWPGLMDPQNLPKAIQVLAVHGVRPYLDWFGHEWLLKWRSKLASRILFQEQNGQTPPLVERQVLSAMDVAYHAQWAGNPHNRLQPRYKTESLPASQADRMNTLPAPDPPEGQDDSEDEEELDLHDGRRSMRLDS